MSFQPINLGTPNNNDGDSLYAGGRKINENFTEIYENLGGSSSSNIKVDVGSSPATSTGLFGNLLIKHLFQLPLTLLEQLDLLVKVLFSLPTIQVLLVMLIMT